MKNRLTHAYDDIISLENLLEAWRGFIRGKRHRRDVQQFELYLMSNIILLHGELKARVYKHSSYEAFNISDPKPRNIHKASVRDRLLHHALYRVLYPFFDRIFIADSYSCRLSKGTHKAINRFRQFGYRVSKNNTKACWVLKCDIKKFFANISHGVLIRILQKHISDKNIVWLLQKVIKSFSSGELGVGLPLGNLTSQLFVNVYMNEFDQFIKHMIKAKYYIRYADDFVLFSGNRSWLEEQIKPIGTFLGERLSLELHPDKISIKSLSSGIDFLGWVHFPDHRVLRAQTKRRLIKRMREKPKLKRVNSYRGLLRHGNTHKILIEVEKEYLDTVYSRQLFHL